MTAHACLTSRNTCLTAFLAPSAVHLQAGATAGFPSSPALWEFLCMRYFRFIGLKCYQIVVLMILLLPGKCKDFFSVLSAFHVRSYSLSFSRLHPHTQTISGANTSEAPGLCNRHSIPSCLLSSASDKCSL